MAITLAAFFIMSVGGQGFSWQQYRLVTRFTDILGLKTGAVVRVAGVEVGTVERIEFVGAEVEVELLVKKEMQPLITTESRASIGSLSLLGAAVVDVSPASAGTPIPDGGMVPSRRAPGPRRQSKRADGLARPDVGVDDKLQNLARAFVEFEDHGGEYKPPLVPLQCHPEGVSPKDIS